MNAITRAIDTLTGKTLKEAAEEVRRTAKSLQDELAEARARIDAEKNAKEAEEAKAAKSGKGA